MAEDISKMAKYIEKASIKTIEKLKRVLIAGGNAVATKAKQNITTLKAIDTGTLRNSITSTSNFDRGELNVQVGPLVNYGVYVEFGTYKMASRPYLVPAFNIVKPKVEAKLLEVLKGIDK